MLSRWERVFGISPSPSDSPVTRRTNLAFKWSAIGKKPTYNQIVQDLQTLMGPVFVQIVHTASANARPIYPGYNGVSVSYVIVTNGGSAYGSPPTVTFSAPSAGGVRATGTAVLTGGVVTSVTITNAGSGYACPPTVTFGSGAATGTVVMLNASPYDSTGTTTAGVSYVDWWSAVANIAVQVTFPSNLPFSVSQNFLHAGLNYLDGALPAWCTYCAFSIDGFTLDTTNFDSACLSS